MQIFLNNVELEWHTTLIILLPEIKNTFRVIYYKRTEFTDCCVLMEVNAPKKLGY